MRGGQMSSGWRSVLLRRWRGRIRWTPPLEHRAQPRTKAVQSGAGVRCSWCGRLVGHGLTLQLRLANSLARSSVIAVSDNGAFVVIAGVIRRRDAGHRIRRYLIANFAHIIAA